MTEPSIRVDEMSYEQAFAELEEIVRLLETDSKTLEESLALFERGQSLANRCVSLLDQADLRIRQLASSTGEE
jgi:exodeoxyribonuclease VII small subunit